MTDIVDALRDPDLLGKEYRPARLRDSAADEIERLREALKQYRDGKYSGYVTLPCGWDDSGTLASYALEGASLDDYILDCECVERLMK